MALFQTKDGGFLPWTDHSQVVPSFQIFTLSVTNFPKENNAEYNGIRKMNNCAYGEWKKAFDADSASDAEFMRDFFVGKVDEHTAICSMDVFDPEKMQAMFEDPEMKKIEEEMGLVHEVYQLQPMQG
jgi:hypothetical protein